MARILPRRRVRLGIRHTPSYVSRWLSRQSHELASRSDRRRRDDGHVHSGGWFIGDGLFAAGRTVRAALQGIGVLIEQNDLSEILGDS